MEALVADLVSPNLITVIVGTKIDEANAMMQKKSIRHLPIVNVQGEIIGLLSQRDVCNMREKNRLLVDNLMTSPVKSVPYDTPLRIVVLKMLEMKISSFLITNELSKVVGIITTDDVLWYLSEILKDTNRKLPGFKTINLQKIGEIANELNVIRV